MVNDVRLSPFPSVRLSVTLGVAIPLVQSTTCGMPRTMCDTGTPHAKRDTSAACLSAGKDRNDFGRNGAFM